MGQSKASKYVGAATRKRLAENLRARMAARYGDQRNQPRKLAERAGTTMSQVQRILGEEVGASVDMLEQLAKALGLQPFELLAPPAQSRPEASVPFERTPGGAPPVLRQTDQPREHTGTPSTRSRRIRR